MKECDEIFEKLVEARGTNLGLERVLKADALLGSPSERFRAIHVAGTNGKGTVSTKIAKTLMKMGFKVGLFTSPHIETFRERIQIDGRIIPEKEALDGIREIFNVASDVTFFEIMALLAFCYFDKEGVDYAVFETGLGGEKDATNILKPILSVITNISYDHAHLLGPSLDHIAKAKAGIIKHQTPVVLGSRAVKKPILKKAFEMEAPIHFVKPTTAWMEENQAIATTALRILVSTQDFNVTMERPPCRFEEHENIIFDAAHNEDGISQLLKEVKRKHPRKKVYTIFSLASSKDSDRILPVIKGGSDYLFYYESDHPRLAKYEEFKAYLPAVKHEDVDKFIARALKDNAILLVTGSFFIMSNLKDKLGISIVKDPFLLQD